ncbi:MAG TPA: hypothetical protein VLU92_11900 [Candidatus Dormibacteraeota bacterium]|nr:hypothetical protein [Candidatus Dormibacteraeota bacterium]
MSAGVPDGAEVFGRPGSAVTVVEAELFPAPGSDWSSAVLVAVLVTGVVTLTVATMERVACAVLARAPMFHIPVADVYVVPALGVAETSVRPAGSRSVTWTPVALLGPLFLAVTVKVTLVF